MKYWKNTYENYSIEDFLFDESFIKWIERGKPTDHEWSYRLETDAHLKAEAEFAERIISSYWNNDLPNESELERIERVKRAIDLKISSATRIDGLQPLNGKETIGKQLIADNRYWWAAASLFIVAMSFYVLFHFLELSQSSKGIISEEVKRTKKGQKLTTYLSDGSSVKLNAESQIRYTKYFSDSIRVVFLKGEAFFDVAKDKRPFVVYAGSSKTIALGTSFNIDITPDNRACISLISGSVLVSNENKEEVILTPGKKVYVGDKFSSIEKWDYSQIAWYDDIIFFKHACKDEVFERLEEWYGVRFKFIGTLNHEWRYTGRFKNQSLQSVLDVLGHTEHFSYQFNDLKILINFNENMKTITN